MRLWKLLAATLALGAVLALAASCGDDGDDGGAAPTLVPGVTPSPTDFVEPQTPEGGGTPFSGTIEPDLLAQARALENLATEVIGAFQERDAQRLRGTMVEQLRQQTSDAQIQDLFSCVPEGVQLALGRASTDVRQQQITADVEVEITENGETRRVDRQWSLAQLPDGSFALAALPDCPYE